MIRIDYLADHRDHIPTIAKWQLSEWGHLHVRDTLERRISRLRSQLNRDSIPLTLVAFRNSSLTGSASLVDHDLPERDHYWPWLASVYVHPPYRRQGIGSALVIRIVEEVRRLDIATVYLFTWDQEKLYAQLGWNVVERLNAYRKQVVVMRFDTDVINNIQ